MLSCIIDAMEGHVSETAEISGAFQETDYEMGYIHTIMEGKMVTLLEDIDPDYYKGFIYLDICCRKWMYTEAKNAIYGTLEVSVLFCTKLSKSLDKMAYHGNKYDWYVMIKNFKGKNASYSGMLMI